jgi:hypothetical protein
MSDPRGVSGDPAQVKRSRWWIWVVGAVALAIVLALVLGKDLMAPGGGPTRVDSAQGTAADAQTGVLPGQPGTAAAPAAEGASPSQ